MYRLIAVSIHLLISVASLQALGDSPEAFMKRVQSAYAASDKMAALEALFYLADVDPETLQIYKTNIVPRRLGQYDMPQITLEPLQEDFNAMQVIGAYEYRPNVLPFGYLVLDGRTKVPYGERDGWFYLTATTRTEIVPAPPPDIMLQMMVIGFAHPPLTYEGHCEIMQGNGEIRRMTLEDAGNGANTAIITAQYIESCELQNTSGRGALSLHLLEGENEIFQRRVEIPDIEILYQRSK